MDLWWRESTGGTFPGGGKSRFLASGRGGFPWGYFRCVWTAVYQFWAYPIWAPKLGKPRKKIFL